MKKTTGWIFVILFLCNAMAYAQGDSLQDWVGAYDYEEIIPGASVGIYHSLQVIKIGENYTALLKSEGYQTDQTLVCELEVNDQSLWVNFISYPDGTTQNIYGVEVYKPGDVLLVLRQNDDGELLTDWHALILNDENIANGQEYFVKR